ncbi:hypothetical protein DPMN_041762 [Dreissena polymorpha]|uniref:Uncharacterized protein n=1 Tax=Dreissena polymorpha TaxID=45954 RepID=A0A9D4CZE4_DREPO|nr:hypothetical protein DPMN_041762 [Dreissena polymorpha]
MLSIFHRICLQLHVNSYLELEDKDTYDCISDGGQQLERHFRRFQTIREDHSRVM